MSRIRASQVLPTVKFPVKPECIKYGPGGWTAVLTFCSYPEQAEHGVLAAVREIVTPTLLAVTDIRDNFRLVAFTRPHPDIEHMLTVKLALKLKAPLEGARA
jgi:hypothetical protein